MSPTRLALLLATERYEDFYGRDMRLSVQDYLQNYRNDWSWDFARMLRAQDIETLIYIASTKHAGRHETPDGYSVRFLPLGRAYAPYVRTPILKRSPPGRYLGQIVNALSFLSPLRLGIQTDGIHALLVQEYWTGRFDVLTKTLALPVLAIDQGLPDKREIKAFKRHTMPRAYRLITQTERERCKVARYRGAGERIPNAVDADRFAPPPDRQVRADRSILVVARLLDVQKRISDVIRALETLPADWRLRVVGNGPDEQLLRELADALGVADRVDFAGFIGDKADIIGELHNCTVFALPSAYEGLPMALLEAMSTGTAVVGSDIPAIAEVVTHGKDGLLHPVGDSRRLGELIVAAAEQREQLGAAARSTIVSQYSQAVVGGRLAELVHASLRSTSPP